MGCEWFRSCGMGRGRQLLTVICRFDAWIRHVDAYTGQELLYLNPKGTVPAVAALKPGATRENPFKEKRKFNMTSFDEPIKDEESDEEVEEPVAKSAKGAKLAELEG